MRDVGHELTDAELARLEKKIRREYQQAVKETQAKLEDYLRRFEIKDEKWRLMVADGRKTEAEYIEWRKGQIMVGKRWEEMKNTLAEDYHNANVNARAMVDKDMPGVYALNHNYATFTVEKGAMVDTSYTLYSHDTVQSLLRDEPELLQPPGRNMKARIAAGKDVAWQKGQIQSVTLQAILQGESIPNMSKRIAQTMGETNHKATVRYARTAITSAENRGRLDGYNRAADMGIKMRQTWIATLDGRTRHEHRMLDGQTVDIDEPFKVDGYELRFPGDPQAPGYLVWNCRCTTIAQIKGFERDPQDLGLRRDENLGNMSYEEWREAQPHSQDILHQEQLGEAMRWKTIREDYGGAGTAGNKLPSTLKGLSMPTAPNRSDYTNDISYKLAKAKYEFDKEWYNMRVESFVSKTIQQKSMSVGEFENWCSKVGAIMYNDCSPVDGRALTLMTNRVEKLMGDFPIVSQYYKEKGLKYEIAFYDTGDFYADASKGFAFGGAFKSLPNLSRSFAKQVAVGNFTVGDGTINKLFDHEFGHNLYQALFNQTNGKIDKFIGLNSSTWNLSSKSGASIYALANNKEAFAEAFSSWYGGERTEFALACETILKEAGLI